MTEINSGTFDAETEEAYPGQLQDSERAWGEHTTTATLTIDADVEQLIREIVRDEIEKIIGEKKSAATKAIMSGLTKAVMAAGAKAQPQTDNSVHVANTEKFGEALKAKRDKDAQQQGPRSV